MNTGGAFRRTRATSRSATVSGRSIGTNYDIRPSRDGKPMLVVNWSGHDGQFILWPEADGYWRLVPIVEPCIQRGQLQSLRGL
jgi:hypothetical protein